MMKIFRHARNTIGMSHRDIDTFFKMFQYLGFSMKVVDIRSTQEVLRLEEGLIASQGKSKWHEHVIREKSIDALSIVFRY